MTLPRKGIVSVASFRRHDDMITEAQMRCLEVQYADFSVVGNDDVVREAAPESPFACRTSALYPTLFHTFPWSPKPKLRDLLCANPN